MQSKIVNEFGTISIDSEVIARIAGSAVAECYGVVGMAARNMRDGLAHLLKPGSVTKGVRLSVKEEKLVIELHIMVQYGTNVAAIADTLISNVKYKVEEHTGIPVCAVNIFVEGVRI